MITIPVTNEFGKPRSFCPNFNQVVYDGWDLRGIETFVDYRDRLLLEHGLTYNEDEQTLTSESTDAMTLFLLKFS